MEQKLALVTGASRGLGRALAEGLGARGWHVVAVARTTGALEELDDAVRAAGGGGSTTLAPMDVTTPAAMIQLAQAIGERWKGLDLWAHTAIHAAPLGPAPDMVTKDWNKSVACNLEATRGLITLLAPLLRARGGTALFFDDPKGGQPFYGAYGATKAAQIALAQSWQAESRRIGPHVVIDRPAAMPTALRGRFHPGEERERLTHPRVEAARILAELLDQPPRPAEPSVAAV